MFHSHYYCSRRITSFETKTYTNFRANCSLLLLRFFFRRFDHTYRYRAMNNVGWGAENTRASECIHVWGHKQNVHVRAIDRWNWNTTSFARRMRTKEHNWIDALINHTFVLVWLNWLATEHCLANRVWLRRWRRWRSFMGILSFDICFEVYWTYGLMAGLWLTEAVIVTYTRRREFDNAVCPHSLCDFSTFSFGPTTCKFIFIAEPTTTASLWSPTIPPFGFCHAIFTNDIATTERPQTTERTLFFFSLLLPHQEYIETPLRTMAPGLYVPTNSFLQNNEAI